VESKKIKGSISNKIVGVFKKDKKIRYKRFISIFLKNSICSKKLVIKIMVKNVKNTLKNEILNKLIRNFIYVFIFY